MAKIMKASEKVRKAAYEQQQKNAKIRSQHLLERLREKSSMDGDIWDEMAQELENKLKK